MFDHPELVFGWRTALMLIAELHLLITAVVLVRRSWDRTAYRLLAAALIVVAGVLTPQMIGFAGFYDAWPWLSFAPFDHSLALGPLIYGFTIALTRATLSRGFFLLLTPALLVFVYQVYWFLQPLQQKWAHIESFHAPYVQPLVNVLSVMLAVAGVVASLMQVRRYREWLERTTSVRADFDPGWLSACLWAFGAAAVVWVATNVIQAVHAQLSYAQLFPSYLFLAAATYSIAQLALIRGREPFPKMPPGVWFTPSPAPAQRDPDRLAEDARLLRAFVKEHELHLEPRLTLSELARRRASNTGDLSRLINQGLGINFNRFVNELRVEEACRRLRHGDDDILSIALASGFGSKATFNRVFRELTGEPPSAWRARNGATPGLDQARS